MASNETKRELVDRIYKLRRGDIDTAVQLVIDLIDANYWNRETSDMVTRSFVRNDEDLDELLKQLATVPGATGSF